MAKSPELNIIPDGPHLYASESVVHMLAELNKRLEEAVDTSDRYREAQGAFDRMQALRVADTDNRYGDAVQLLREVLERAGYEDLTYSFDLLLDDIAGERRSSPDLDLPVVRVATLTAERDRYREALESIANPYVLDAEAQTWIARAALGLDGEG